jgi:hypothetical protein
MLFAVALSLALLQDAELEAVVERACDLDPAVRAEAAKDAARLVGSVVDARPLPARIVLALAGKHDPLLLLRLPDRGARQVACDLLTPTKALLPDVLALLESRDRGVRIAAARALGRVHDEDLRKSISSAMGHGMRSASGDDVLYHLVSSSWKGHASPSLLTIAGGDAERAGLAVAALCNGPFLALTEGYGPSLLRALDNEKIERPLRSLLIRVVGRASPWALCPALAVRDRDLRAELLQALDRGLVDPLSAPALHAAARDPKIRRIEDATRWIDGRLKKLCGDDVTIETYPAWAQANYRTLVEKRADEAVARGVAGLKKLGEHGTSWKRLMGGQVGLSAFSAYALLKSDVAADDPAVTRCLDTVLDQEPQGNYATSLSALALAAAVEKGAPRRERLARRLQTIADILAASQLKSGGWSYVADLYKPPVGWNYDLSNTQFAILGLRAAANAGATVPRSTWERALVLLEKANLEDGGWTYQGKDTPSYPRMTAAGACSWIICRISLDEKLAPETAADSFRIRNAAQWLAGATDAARMASVPDYYLLYSVERLCMTAGIPTLGGRDWYAEGAGILVRSQGPDGAWRGVHGEVPDTCMALLFLRKAYVARPEIATEAARRVTPEQAREVHERRLEALLAEGATEVRVERDGRSSYLLVIVASDADAKRLAGILGRELDGVPLKFRVRE